MTEVMHLSDYKKPEQLLEELANKVGECEKYRDALITYLSGLYKTNDYDNAVAQKLKDFIVNFEVKAIYPVKHILNLPAAKKSDVRIDQQIQILNTWLLYIHEHFGIAWQDRPSADIIVFPDPAPKEA